MAGQGNSTPQARTCSLRSARLLARDPAMATEVEPGVEVWIIPAVAGG